MVKQKETIKVFVKEEVEIIVNGRKRKIEKGIQELDKGTAEILIDSGVAERLKEGVKQ